MRRLAKTKGLSVRLNLPVPEEAAGGEWEEIDFATFLEWTLTPGLVGRLLSYSRSRLFTERLEVVNRPFAIAVLLRLLTRGECRFETPGGVRRPITWLGLLRRGWELAREWPRAGEWVRRMERDTAALLVEAPRWSSRSVGEWSHGVAYLRTDHWFGCRAGGSVAHVSGVVNGLLELGVPVTLLTTERIPLVAAAVPQLPLVPPGELWEFAELPVIISAPEYARQAAGQLRGARPAFIYHRYSLHNYSGVLLSRELGLPLVVEFNGSEVWMSRHWGVPLRRERLAELVERLNLAWAVVVVVVSRAMAELVITLGVDPAKVLIDPNGVDTERYHPGVDGEAVRSAWGLTGRVVVGFIGTFGRWHGAEVLVEAFGYLLRERPGLRERVVLLMVGSGVTRRAARELATTLGVGENCRFVGEVPQEVGPTYLAACDILVSPQVPNPDGTPFFGSPTKLFEYLAMGRAVVASDLDQLGEVVRDGVSGLLVPPGAVAPLARALERLVEDSALRERLGREGRLQAVREHTWRAHVQRILDRLGGQK